MRGRESKALHHAVQQGYTIKKMTGVDAREKSKKNGPHMSPANPRGPINGLTDGERTHGGPSMKWRNGDTPKWDVHLAVEPLTSFL